MKKRKLNWTIWNAEERISNFLITEGKKISPVEVKSGNCRSHSSLDKFRKYFSSVIGNSYILYTKDVVIKHK